MCSLHCSLLTACGYPTRQRCEASVVPDRRHWRIPDLQKTIDHKLRLPLPIGTSSVALRWL